jgi:hypothetical protein
MRRTMTMQRGGFLVGLVVGLLIGLAAALAVALYVTKVPVPFINKVPQRTADQDAAEAERNKTWDPNAGLAPRPAARPPGAPSAPARPAGTGRDPCRRRAPRPQSRRPQRPRWPHRLRAQPPGRPRRG